MKLVDQIKSDLKEAMKEKNEPSILTYRGLLSAIHNKEIELKHELNDEETIQVLQTQAKQREDSISEFKKGGRDDLVKKESFELDLIKKYLPQKMTEDEIEKIIDEVIKKLRATSRKDMGQVMGEVMKQGKGQIDGATASRLVQEKLKP